MTKGRMKRLQETIDVITIGYLAQEMQVQDEGGLYLLFSSPRPSPILTRAT